MYSYNFAAGSFHTKKLCILFSTEFKIFIKIAKSPFVPSFGGVWVTYMVHLWLVGKRVVDFLLALIELFRQLSRLRRYEQILVEIVLFKGGGSL